jgi:hypothetical protein
MICEFCDGLGWLHAIDLDGGRPHIERCDECAIFASDMRAAEAHAAACGCPQTYVLD